MTKITKPILATLALLSLAACGGDAHDATHTTKSEAEKMDHGNKDKNIGHTTGTVISVSPDGKAVTIDHEEIDGIGMGAMTMGFDIISSVDLSGFDKDDKVSFMVKKGRDNSYRITAICNTDTDGADCLDALMDHDGH